MRNAQRRESGVTFRAMVIGSILVVVNAYWLTVTSELTVSLLTFISLFFNAVFTLFVLVVGNGLVKRAFPKHTLSAQELLVIYIMVVMVSTVGGHTLMTFLIGIIAHPFRFATAENEWAELFWRYIPSWFVPSQSVLNGYFEGESTLYDSQNLRGWIVPVLVWTGFIAIIWFTLLCINVMIRAQWTQQEKLAYPIIQLPVRMTIGSTFWKNRAMWFGFGIAVTIELFAGLNHLFPQVPAVNIRFHTISNLFSEKPWNAMGWVAISAFPFIIGLTFFIPLDLSFTAWVLYVVKKIERVIRIGILGEGELYFTERAGGAWMTVGVLALWTTRHHLLKVWRKALNADTPIDDSREPMRYRTALIGAIVGLVGISIFSAQAGMSFIGIAGFIVIYVVLSLGVTRVRAELGPPSHEILYLDPGRMLVSSFGPRRIGSANLTLLSFYYWLNRLNTAPPMPNQLEAFKIAERTRIDHKRLIWVMMFATILGTLASFWSYLHLLYGVGAESVAGYVVGIGQETFGWRLQTWLTYAESPENGMFQGLGLGAIITCSLYFLRRQFFWWPFSPVGYAMIAHSSGGLSDYWFSIFLGWLIKVVIVTQFGLKFNRRAIFFFLGLILGDYISAIGWSIVGLVFNVQTYVLW